MRSKHAWIVAALAVVLVVYAYLRARSGMGDAAVSAALSRSLGIEVGARVAAEGRVITSLPLRGTTLTPDAPLGLYPGALLQGLTLTSTPRGSEVEVLLGTDDSEEQALHYYETLWATLGPARRKPDPSILYARTDPKITEQLLVLKTGATVTVQRGDFVPPMRGAEFAAVLHGRAPLPVQRGHTTTEIWLSAPVKPAGSTPGA